MEGVTKFRPSDWEADGKLDPQMALLDDASLADYARQGRGTAMEVLWVRHFQAAVVYARRCGAPDPEDVVAETFACILRMWNEGRGPEGNFRAYLYKSVRNLCIKKTQREEAVTISDFDGVSRNGKDEYKALEEQSALAAVFYAMRPRYRRFLWLSEVEGFSVEEIAGHENVSHATVSLVVHRAKKQFMKLWLEQDGLGQELGKVADGGLAADGHRSTALGAKLAGGVAGTSVALAAGQLSASAAASPPGLPSSIATRLGWGTRVLTHGVALVAGVTSVAVVGAGAGLALSLSNEGSADLPPAPVVTSSAAPVPPTVRPSASPPSPAPAESETVTPAPSPAPTASAVPPTPTPTVTPSSTPSPAPSATPLPRLRISRIDTGPDGVCNPTVSGFGLPGSAIQLTGLIDQPVSLVVDPDGRWTTGRVALDSLGSHDIAVWDASGKQLSAGATVTVASPPNVGITRQADGDLRATVTGQAGLAVVIRVDGIPLGTLVIDAGGTTSQVLPATLEAGAHEVSYGYVTARCQGPLARASVSF